MDAEYIKKCPFCGSLAKPRRYYNSYEGTKYFIECIQCGATSSHRPTEEYAVEQWNRRINKWNQKKYYLKHKFLIEPDIEDVNLEVCSKEWFFDRESNLCYVQKRFTEEEIKELENDGWILENYRKIEVEDE